MNELDDIEMSLYYNVVNTCAISLIIISIHFWLHVVLYGVCCVYSGPRSEKRLHPHILLHDIRLNGILTRQSTQKLLTFSAIKLKYY